MYISRCSLTLSKVSMSDVKQIGVGFAASVTVWSHGCQVRLLSTNGKDITRYTIRRGREIKSKEQWHRVEKVKT